MTAKEFIKKLQELDPDTMVLINSDFGNIPGENISMIVVDDDDNNCSLRCLRNW